MYVASDGDACRCVLLAGDCKEVLSHTVVPSEVILIINCISEGVNLFFVQGDFAKLPRRLYLVSEPQVISRVDLFASLQQYEIEK